MKVLRNQLEFELQTAKECRSPRRAKKANPARVWFEKMRQVVDDATERPVPPVLETPELLGKEETGARSAILVGIV